MRRFTLLFSVLLLAVTFMFMGVGIYESNHNNSLKFTKQKLSKYSEKNSAFFIVDPVILQERSISIEQFNSDMIQIVNELQGDLIITNEIFRSSDPSYEGKTPIADELQTFIYSKNPKILPDYYFTKPNVDWSAKATEMFTTEPNQGLNQITNQVHDIHGYQKYSFIPFIQLANHYDGSSPFPMEALILTDSPLGEAQRVFDKKGYEWISLGDQPEYVSYFTKNALNFFYLLLLPIFLIIIASYSLDVIDASKEIGVRKMQGQGSRFIAQKKFYDINILIPIVLLMGLIITGLFVIKDWNALTAKFLVWVFLIAAGLMFVQLIAFLISLNYISKVHPVTSTKKSKDLLIYHLQGLLTKVLLILLLMTQAIAIIPEVQTAMNNKKAQSLYPHKLLFLEPVAEAGDFTEINKIKRDLHEGWNDAKSLGKTILHDAHLKGWETEIMDDQGNFSKYISSGDTVIIDRDSLKNQSILDASGNTFNPPADNGELYLLLPPDRNLEELPPIKGGMLQEAAKTARVIPIQENQVLYSPEGYKSVNAVILLASKKVRMFPFKFQLIDTPENKALLTKILDEKGLKPDQYNIKSRDAIGENLLTKRTLPRDILVSIFLLIALGVTIFHNIFVFMKDRSKLYALQYLHGIPFFKRTWMLWVLALVPYLVSVMVGYFAPQFLYWVTQLKAEYDIDGFVKIPFTNVLIGLGIIFIVDLLVQFLMIKWMERKNSKLLKGEM